MPELMIFSRPVAPGIRRKDMDGCYILGEWTVVPDERRIERNGYVVGMNRNLMDALLCLIDAQGEFVCLERLKTAMWPSAFIDDEAAQFYMDSLKKALERHSGPATVVERSPEHGYRLLVGARRAGPEDSPKDDRPTRQLPVDFFKVDADVAQYILQYHGDLLTDLERRVRNYLTSQMMTMSGCADLTPEVQALMSEERPGYLSTDPEVLKLASDGPEAFAERAASRILEDYGDRLSLNRCPRCACLARTPTAHQCRYCGLDWHDG